MFGKTDEGRKCCLIVYVCQNFFFFEIPSTEMVSVSVNSPVG